MIVIGRDLLSAYFAKKVSHKLMTSESLADHAKLAAQARLIEAYERERWPQKSPALADPARPHPSGFGAQRISEPISWRSMRPQRSVVPFHQNLN